MYRAAKVAQIERDEQASEIDALPCGFVVCLRIAGARAPSGQSAVEIICAASYLRKGDDVLYV